MFYTDNSVYEGEFESGRKHAKGIMKYGDSEFVLESYDGEYKHGLRHGEGKLSFKDSKSEKPTTLEADEVYHFGLTKGFTREIYQGSFSQNRKHGKGVHFYSDGSWYDGDYEKDQITGTGTFYYGPTSTHYIKFEGEFFENKKHGFGTLSYRDGGKYVGCYKDNLMHGEGTRFYGRDERVFEKFQGQWVNGLKHGLGLSFLRKGGFYEGVWKDGKRDGESGIYDEGGANEQIVVFKEGRRNGFLLMENSRFLIENHNKNALSMTNPNLKPVGNHSLDPTIDVKVYSPKLVPVFYWFSNSDRYEGEFKNNLPHGHGKVIRGNGDKIVGKYKKGILHEFAQYFWKNGDYFEGEFKNGVRNGNGEFYTRVVNSETELNSQKGILHSIQCCFLNGLPEGLGILFLRNSLRFLVEFEHGFVRSDLEVIDSDLMEKMGSEELERSRLVVDGRGRVQGTEALFPE